MTANDFMLDLLFNSKYATGADFSHWKGNWAPSPSVLPMLQGVMDFAILRAGYGAADGKSYEDRNFRVNYQKTIEFIPGALRGCYWYFSSKSPWQSQLDFFLKTIEGLEFDFFALDIESAYNDKTKAFALGGVYWMEALQKIYPSKKIFVYSDRYVYDGWMSAFTNGYDKFPLWLAQYPWKDWLTTFTDWFRKFWQKVIMNQEYQPSLPKSRSQYDLWQFVAASMIGKELGFASDELDFNISRLPKAEFVEFILGKPEEPEPTEPVIPMVEISKLGPHKERLAAYQERLEEGLLEFDSLLEDLDSLLEDVG